MYARSVRWLSRPTRDQVSALRDEQRGLPFTYPDVGSTREGGACPPGFDREAFQVALAMETVEFFADALKR